MDKEVKNKFKKTIIIFNLLLLYVIAAVIWLFILLSRQNDEMRTYQVEHLNTTISRETQEKNYNAGLFKIEDQYRRNRLKYAGEGIVFLGLILLGAFYIFRSIRQQMRMQQQQQNFMMAVTHELKTPIAVSKLNLETLLKHQLAPEKQNKIVKMTLEETERLDLLTNNILVSSQLESSAYKLNVEDIDFSALLQDRVREFRTRFPEINFTEAIEADNELSGDPLLLQILVNNLLENAVKYSGKGSVVSVILKKAEKTANMTIADEGSGVPDDEKFKVFNKFYRIGNEATRKTKGSGLGLYLCKKIADDHDADIRVTDNKPKGSKFEVIFRV